MTEQYVVFRSGSIPVAPQIINFNNMKKLDIEFKDWEHNCGDGCCYTYGTDIYLNGERLDEQHAEDSKNALKAVLEKLGYKVEFTECENFVKNIF